MTSTGSSSSSKNNSSPKSNSNANETAKEFLETFDWIEIALDRIQRVIGRLDTKVNSIYTSWSDRNSNLVTEISYVQQEIELNQKAFDRYVKQAESVGLSDYWAALVREGTVDISTITDESLAEKIKEYQSWFDKAIDCKYANDELIETLGDLRKTSFDHIITQYDGMLSIIEHEKNLLDEYISRTEKKGYLVSVEYYSSLLKVERENILQLQKEKDALIVSMNSAVNSGDIKKGSEAWNDMVKEINDVTLAIEESNTALIDYNNSIRDLNWQIFDLVLDRISRISDESDFLINLLSNKDLYGEKGKFTDIGTSVMGLHGVNYNTYMSQADKYSEEMKKIQSEINSDPYNQTLINRRNELLELQQESILAAENEKQSIVSLVEEGINLELSALQELIDKYNDALNSQKDLYDYQKKVAKQTKEIASIEKQLSAYANDTSEESKAKIQQLKVSLEESKENLEETEYERYINDQKKLLDELYLEYETVLNERLDNIDLLISDVINEINSSSSTINSTLAEQVTNVGYTLTDEMRNIWSGSGDIGNILTTYSNNFTSIMTSVQNTINTISTNISTMVAASNEKAKAVSSNASNSSASSNSQTPPTNSNNSNNSNNTNSNGNIFISKKDSYPKSKLQINTSIVDRLKYFDFDASWDARAKYYASMGFSGTYLSSEKQNVGMIGWMKSNGYKKGAKNIKSNELAWTNENTPETIIRKSDGAILTPLNQGDMVLNTNAHENIWSMANSPEKFIKDNFNNDTNNLIPENITNAPMENNIELNFNLENVHNANELIKVIQHDRRVQNALLDTVVNPIFGGSSLAKNKIR